MRLFLSSKTSRKGGLKSSVEPGFQITYLKIMTLNGYRILTRSNRQCLIFLPNKPHLPQKFPGPQKTAFRQILQRFVFNPRLEADSYRWLLHSRSEEFLRRGLLNFQEMWSGFFWEVSGGDIFGIEFWGWMVDFFLGIGFLQNNVHIT